MTDRRKPMEGLAPRHGFHRDQFDFEAWHAALSRAVDARKVKWTDVAEATGVSNTTLSRMKEDRRPDAASLAALSAWAGINPAEYVLADRPSAAPLLVAMPPSEELERLANAAQAVLDHRHQMGAGMQPVHNELAMAITSARAVLADRATRCAEKPSDVVTMSPMEFDDGRIGWYVNHPDFFADIEPDAETGQWSVFFKDKQGREGFAERATAPLAVGGVPTTLAQGFDGSAIRVGPNHTTIEVWFDTEAQAVEAHELFLRVIDGAAPDGHVIVPREPTPAMLKAGQTAIPGGHGQAWIYTIDAWRAMIAATPPQAPQADKGPTAMSPAEQKYLMRHPDALLLLMDYHDQQQDQADSMDAGTTGDAKRAEELKAIGAAILRDDAEIWTDELLRRFGVNP